MTEKLEDKLNRIAMMKFQNLRSTMKLDFTSLELKKAELPLLEEEAILGTKNIHTLTNDDFNCLFESDKITNEVKNEIAKDISYVDMAMDYITSLNLPSAQSLEIGLIISGTRKIIYT